MGSNLSLSKRIKSASPRMHIGVNFEVKKEKHKMLYEKALTTKLFGSA